MLGVGHKPSLDGVFSLFFLKFEDRSAMNFLTYVIDENKK